MDDSTEPIKVRMSKDKSEKRFQFRILSILLLTIVVAVLLAVRDWLLTAIGVLIVLAHIGVVIGPIVIVVATITLGPQKENRITVSDSPVLKGLPVIWLACVVIAGGFWLVMSSFGYW